MFSTSTTALGASTSSTNASAFVLPHNQCFCFGSHTSYLFCNIRVVKGLQVEFVATASTAVAQVVLHRREN